MKGRPDLTCPFQTARSRVKITTGCLRTPGRLCINTQPPACFPFCPDLLQAGRSQLSGTAVISSSSKKIPEKLLAATHSKGELGTRRGSDAGGTRGCLPSFPTPTPAPNDPALPQKGERALKGAQHQAEPGNCHLHWAILPHRLSFPPAQLCTTLLGPCSPEQGTWGCRCSWACPELTRSQISRCSAMVRAETGAVSTA